MKPFSEQLRIIMEKRGISQSELCEKTGIPKSAISQYLSGSFRPKQERTYLLANALQTTPEFLMGFTDDTEIPTGNWTIIPGVNDGYPVPVPIKDIYVSEQIQKIESDGGTEKSDGEQPTYLKKITGRVVRLSEEEQKKAWEILKTVFGEGE